jgi:lipopolysaccharide transport system ATP-binding protein
MIFVSHSMPMVSRICNEIILMDHGKVEFQGSNTGKGIDMYYDMFKMQEDSEIVFDSGDAKISSSNIVGKTMKDGFFELGWNSDFQIELEIENLKLDNIPYFSFAIYDKEQRGIAEVYPKNQDITKAFKKGETKKMVFDFKNFNFSKGLYSFTITLSKTEKTDVYYKEHRIINITITDTEQIWTPILLNSTLISDNEKYN